MNHSEQRSKKVSIERKLIEQSLDDQENQEYATIEDLSKKFKALVQTARLLKKKAPFSSDEICDVYSEQNKIYNNNQKTQHYISKNRNESNSLHISSQKVDLQVKMKPHLMSKDVGFDSFNVSNIIKGGKIKICQRKMISEMPSSRQAEKQENQAGIFDVRIYQDLNEDNMTKIPINTYQMEQIYLTQSERKISQQRQLEEWKQMQKQPRLIQNQECQNIVGPPPNFLHRKKMSIEVAMPKLNSYLLDL